MGAKHAAKHALQTGHEPLIAQWATRALVATESLGLLLGDTFGQEGQPCGPAGELEDRGHSH